MPYTYRQLQEWILERRRRQESDATERTPRQLVTSVEDLATKLRELASDAIVVKHFVEFALPSKKRASATEVLPKAVSAALNNSSQVEGDSTDHAIGTDETQDAGDEAICQPHVGRTTTGDITPRATSDSSEHATSNATERAAR